MPCRAVHICAYCEAQGVEFQGVHASAERAHARPATSDCFFFPRNSAGTVAKDSTLVL
jgi:hypothetical protein